MSHTIRIYNDARRWFKARIKRVSEGYQDGMWAIRNWPYHPFKQHNHFTCHCSWCRPKSTQKGSLRVQHKSEIQRELLNL